MNTRTRDTMIGISLVLNILLAATLLYDYTVANSRFTILILAAYFVYTLVFLFMWALGRREEHAVDALATYVLDTGQILNPDAARHAMAHPQATMSLPAPLPVPPPASAGASPPAMETAPSSKPGPARPFQYEGFTLYSRDVDLKNGGRRTIWFFAKHTPKSGSMAAKPAGYHVGVNERTGLPFLKKGTGADGEDLTPNIVQAYRPQCSALTDEGHQCRNSARHESKYCVSHFGYQPPAIAKAAANREDTLPRVKGAKDTKPSVRSTSA